jgi:hypothetical protein
MAQGTTKGVPIDIDPLLALDSDLVVPSQKAIKAYVDAKKSAADSDYVNVAGDTMIGNLILNADPTINLGAATKQYVDNYINGLDYKAAAHVGTVAALPAYTVSVNKLVLTGTANGPILTATFDNHDPQVGERVLIKNETSTLASNNGIYVVTQVGTGSLPFILTRSDDANTPAKLGEATLSIIYGDTLANTIWHCTPASVPITIGTTNLTFIQVGSGSVGTGTTGNLAYWDSPSSLGSLATVPVGNGGTAIASYTVGDMLYADTGNVLLKLSMPMNQNSVLVAGTTPSWSNAPSLDTLILRSTASLTLGLAGPSGNTGQIIFRNSATINTITLETGATAASYTLTLPIAAPSGGQYLQFATGGVATWVSGIGSGVTTVGTFSASAQTNGATIASSTITFGPASATVPGMVSILAQTWAGAKTFNSVVTIDAAGSTTTAQLTFNGGTNNWINFGINGTSVPVSGTNRTAGEKIVVYGSAATQQTDFAIGMISSTEMYFGSSGVNSGVLNNTEISFYNNTRKVGAFTNTGLVFTQAATAVATQINEAAVGAHLTIAPGATNSYSTGSSVGYIRFWTSVSGVPTVAGARSVGTRILLNPAVIGGTRASDYAIGVNTTDYETWISGGVTDSPIQGGIIGFWVGYGSAWKRTVWVAENALNLAASTVIVGAGTSQNVFNTVATTLNFAGAATALTIGATTGTATIRNPIINLSNASGQLQINATKVVGIRRTGWTAPVATPSRAALPANPTVLELSQFCAALYQDLASGVGHGLIN